MKQNTEIVEYEKPSLFESMWNKFKNLFSENDDDFDYEDEEIIESKEVKPKNLEQLPIITEVKPKKTTETLIKTSKKIDFDNVRYYVLSDNMNEIQEKIANEIVDNKIIIIKYGFSNQNAYEVSSKYLEGCEKGKNGSVIRVSNFLYLYVPNNVLVMKKAKRLSSIASNEKDLEIRICEINEINEIVNVCDSYIRNSIPVIVKFVEPDKENITRDEYNRFKRDVLRYFDFMNGIICYAKYSSTELDRLIYLLTPPDMGVIITPAERSENIQKKEKENLTIFYENK